MTISQGDRIPAVELKQMTAEGIEPVLLEQFCAGRKVVLFAVPGAFTPTCSDTHLPGFVVNVDALRARGVAEVACTAVNDLFVLHAWGQATGGGEHLTLLADGNGDLAQALGLELDGSGFGMGLRSRRYAAVIDDGVVVYLGVEPGREVGVSSAEAVLAALDAG